MLNSKLLLTLGMATILLAGCGGDDSGSDTVNPTLPAGSVTITADNATAIAISASSTFDTLYSVAGGVDAASLPPVTSLIDIIRDTAFNKDKHNSNIVTGISDTIPCDTGSITDNWSETDTSESGSVTFNSCTLYGITFNGSVRYNSSWNFNTGAYTDSSNGNITMTYQGASFAIALNMTETGNYMNGTYSITLTYSYSGGGIGFLVTTESPLTGIGGGDVSGGILIIQGANNTRLRIVITGECSADIYLDTGTGTFSLHESISTCI